MKFLHSTLTTAIVAASAATLTAGSVHAEATPTDEPDDGWISLSGEVTETGEESFRVDYGDGVITVEMDDWDFYEESEALLAGDHVTATGASTMICTRPGPSKPTASSSKDSTRSSMPMMPTRRASAT